MVYSLDLDITPGGVPQIVKLSQYDKTIPQIQTVLWNGPSGYTIPTGATVWVAGTKPDKTGFEYQCTYTGSTVTIDITEQMTAVAGRVPVEVIVETATGRKGSANFFLDVEPAALADDTIISDTDIPIIQQIPETLAECEDYADLAHKWATYGNDSETPSSTNNALYWAQKSQEYAVGALHWKNSIPFANIPTTGMTVGDMYNITDSFTTDARFDEGAGVKCSAGTNIVWDANSKWDILISSSNAADINFDNTGTDLTATNVQNAITEINTSLSDKQNSTDNSLTTTDKTIPGAINELNSNLTAMYHRRYTNSAARYDIMATMQSSGYNHITITVAGESLLDGGFLYPTLEIPPTNNATILGLARCTDGTTTDCILNLKTNGDMQLSLYNYGSKTVSGIIASGFYN